MYHLQEHHHSHMVGGEAQNGSNKDHILLFYCSRQKVIEKNVLT